MIAAPSPPIAQTHTSEVEALAFAADWLFTYAQGSPVQHWRPTPEHLSGFYIPQVEIAERLLPVGRLWLERAQQHLNQRIDTALRDSPRIDSERAALAILNTAGQELQAAGAALDLAAETLKASGKGFQASQTKQAASRAHRAAEGLTG